LGKLLGIRKVMCILGINNVADITDLACIVGLVVNNSYNRILSHGFNRTDTTDFSFSYSIIDNSIVLESKKNKEGL
jgi:hypothetical protein